MRAPGEVRCFSGFRAACERAFAILIVHGFRRERPFMKINHAILHVFDFVSCVNVYAQ